MAGVDGLVGLPGLASSWTADQQWAQNQQTPHLENVYKTLLKNNNKVLAQLLPHVPVVVRQLAAGGQRCQRPGGRKPLPSQKQKVSECSNCPVKGSTTQYAQAMAVQDAMNAKIAAAVGEVQQWAKTQPGIDPPTCNWRSPTRAPGSSIRRGATIPGLQERHLDTPEQGRARAAGLTR